MTFNTGKQNFNIVCAVSVGERLGWGLGVEGFGVVQG